MRRSHWLICSFVLFACFVGASCAGKRAVIKKGSAYYMERMRGTAMADEKGNELPVKPDTVFVLYLETTRTPVSWDSAWTGGRVFSVASVLLSEKSVEAGLEKGSLTKPVLVTVDSSNYLYRLQLSNAGFSNAPKKLAANELLIRGSYQGKTVYHRSAGFQQLDSYPAY
jgi:hypothetical protein